MSGVAPVIIPVLVTIATAVILAALRYAVNRIKLNIEAQQQLKEEKDSQRAKDQWDMLTRIEAQTMATNGRVTAQEEKTSAILERVANLEGKYDAAIKMLTGANNDRG